MELIITKTLVEREVWRFVFIDGCLYLDTYSLERKKSTRHKKYEKIDFYSRLNFTGRDSNMTEDEVPLSDGVRVAAVMKFYLTLSCKKWSERSNDK